MTLQQHSTDEIVGIVDADVDPAAAIQESKTAYAGSGGHDHDTAGTPTPAVLIVRQLKPTASGPANFLVHIASSTGVAFPDVITPAISAQTVDFSSPLPAGSNKRIDLICVDRTGTVLKVLGTATTGTPVPPSHEGVYPVAEIGPILAGTTTITTGMIKDVRPFLASAPLVRVRQGVTDLGLAHTIVASTNMSASVTSGVATLTASGGVGAPVNADTGQVGVVRVTVDPGVGLDPIALSADDPAVALIASAIQADGSVPFVSDQSMGDQNLTDIGSLLFAGAGTIQAGPSGYLNLVTTGVGKVRIISSAALQLPSTSSPVSPNVGDLWYDPALDAPVVRTASGPKTLSTVQTGSIGMGVSQLVLDPVNPPTLGAVGAVPTLNFSESVGADEIVRFSFQLPEDALLVNDVKVRLVYCMSAAGAGNVAVGYDYTVVSLNGDLTPAAVTNSGTFTITPSGTAEIMQSTEAVVLLAGDLSSRASVSVKIRRRSTDGSDTRNGNWQVLYAIVLYEKKDISSARNVIDVTDEVTGLGQVTGLQFRGNMVSVAGVSGVGVVDITDPGTLAATTTTLGTTQIQPAPAVVGTPVAVGVNATYLPTQDQKDALAGTSGAPATGNRYVTNADTRIPTTTQKNALVGTAGPPDTDNPYVTSTDNRLPMQTENDALAGTAGAGPSGTNKYVLADFVNLPATGEKSALAGSSGTPGVGNKYLTEDDALVVFTDGSRAFTAPQAGIDPVDPEHLATKLFVENAVSGLDGVYAMPVQNLTQLEAVLPNARVDRQLRLVEDEGVVYRFDIEGTGGGVPPNVGLGQWFRTSVLVPDASSTVKGSTKLSVDPLLVGTPIAVGNNDPRMSNATHLQNGLMSTANYLKLLGLNKAAIYDGPSQVTVDGVSAASGNYPGPVLDGIGILGAGDVPDVGTDFSNGGDYQSAVFGHTPRTAVRFWAHPAFIINGPTVIIRISCITDGGLIFVNMEGWGSALLFTDSVTITLMAGDAAKFNVNSIVGGKMNFFMGTGGDVGILIGSNDTGVGRGTGVMIFGAPYNSALVGPG